MIAGNKESAWRRGSPAAKIFHDHAKEYDAWFADNNLVYETELRALQSLPAAKSGPKMEVGVGPGHFARELGVAFGLDPARAPLLLAKKRGIICCQGAGEHLPVKDGVMGSLYLLFTLYFADDPRRILSECARILKKDGTLVICMIPPESKWGKRLAARQEAGHIFYQQACFHALETLRQWLVGLKMSITDARSTLYQHPGNVELVEEPQKTIDKEAGFVAVVAEKDHV